MNSQTQEFVVATSLVFVDVHRLMFYSYDIFIGHICKFYRGKFNLMYYLYQFGLIHAL